MSTKEKVLGFLMEKEGAFVSGAALSKELSISRSAVWKAVESLRDDGYSIHARTNNGYCLSSEGKLSLKRLSLLMPEREIHFHETIDSTNREAKELVSSGCPDGTLVISRRQTGGRGRLGRSFSSPHGGIYLSLVLRPEGRAEDALLLTSAAAVAAAEAIEETCRLHVMIKWVNDLYLQNRKVTGILSEGVLDMESGTLSAVVVGIGINFCTQSGDFPADIRSVAGSLFAGPSAVPEEADPNALVASLVCRLVSSAHALPSRPFLEAYRKRNMLLGKEVSLFRAGKETEGGTVLGIDDDARLVIRKQDGGELHVGSGEVTVRLAQK